MLDVANIKSEDFEPYINQIFYIHPEEGEPVKVELIKLSKSIIFEPER